MKNEQRIQQLEKFYRKCPDVLTVLDAARRTRMSKNTIAAHIRQGKLTAYTYRGKRLISKIDLLEFLAATTDEPALWARKIKPGANKGK